jgi:hypothetical protein
MTSYRARLQRGALAALLLTIAIAAAACGGGSGTASTTSTTSVTSTTGAASTGATSAAMAKYTACLKQNGVTLPTGGPGGGAPPGGTGGSSGTPPAAPTGTSTTARPAFRSGGSAKFAKAQAACASLRPAGLRAGPGGAGGGANSAAFAAYRNCLTLHGVKASATFGPGGATLTASQKKAATACASLRPKRQASTTTTSGNS